MACVWCKAAMQVFFPADNSLCKSRGPDSASILLEAGVKPSRACCIRGTATQEEFCSQVSGNMFTQAWGNLQSMSA